MSKLLAVTVVSLLILITFTSTALAQNTFQINNPLEATTVDTLVNNVIDFLFYLGLAVVPVMVLVGAFYIMTAGGDPDRVTKGRNIIIYALAGILILYAARFLMDVVSEALGVKIL